MKKEKAKLSPRLWFNLITFGLMGQIAWNVENVYFNTFLYNSVYNGAGQEAINGTVDVMTAISRMVAYSAAAAVITTFIMGTLSDKMRNRKLFISLGYIAWGLVTGSFGFISRDNIAAIFGLNDGTKILTVTVWTVIVMDCVMTFMGSTGNDSAFNAWVTDVTEESDRPLVETVLAVLPVAAMGIVAGLGALVVSIGYKWFFIFLGGFVMLCGVLGLFTINDPGKGKTDSSDYLSDLVYGFRPSVIRQNSKLYLTLSAMCIFCSAVQVFFPYILIYFEQVVLKDKEISGLLTPGVIIAAVFAVAFIGAGYVILMKSAGKIGRNKVFYITSALLIAGLFALGFTKDVALILVFAAPTALGYAVITVLLGASIRDYTPEDRAGGFQGVRMIFIVLIPMVVGPNIGKIAINASTFTYINEYNVEMTAPTSVMFTCAAVVAVFVFIPLIFLGRKIKSDKN